MGVDPYLEVVVGRSDLGQHPVRGDTSCLDSGVPDLDTCFYPEGEFDGELVLLLEVSHVELADPDGRDTAHILAASIGHSRDPSIHRCWLSYH